MSPDWVTWAIKQFRIVIDKCMSIQMTTMSQYIHARYQLQTIDLSPCDDTGDLTYSDFKRQLDLVDSMDTTELKDGPIRIELMIMSIATSRKRDSDTDCDFASCEVAYAVELSYFASDHVTVPISIDYRIIQRLTLNRTNFQLTEGESLPIHEVLQTVRCHGLSNVMSTCSLRYYNCTKSKDRICAILDALKRSYPIVFKFTIDGHTKVTKDQGMFIIDIVDTIDIIQGPKSMVGTIVGVLDDLFKIHISDKNLYNGTFIYATKMFIESTLCGDFYIVTVLHNEPEFCTMSMLDEYSDGQD